MIAIRISNDGHCGRVDQKVLRKAISARLSSSDSGGSSAKRSVPK
jgi:hypothetical protein